MKTHCWACCVSASPPSSCTAAAAAHLHGRDPIQIGGAVCQQGARQVKGRSSAPGTRPLYRWPCGGYRGTDCYLCAWVCASTLTPSCPLSPDTSDLLTFAPPPQGRGGGRAPGADAGAEQRQDGQERGKVCPSMIVTSEKHNQQM